MSLDRKTVEYVASLSRIQLDPQELDKLVLQLKEILDFIDKLASLKVEEIPVTSYVFDFYNVMRNDESAGSLSKEEALENAPLKQNNFFVVPKIIE